MRAILARTNQSPRRRKIVRRRLSVPRLLLLTVVVGVGWVGYRHVQATMTKPQAVLVLGGEAERERYAAKFALKHPNLPIWISSGAPREYSEWVFSEAGVDLQRLKLDYRAVDTLTNFTTLVDDLKTQGVTKVYLVTSDYHMRRSRMIGEIILGSRGIDFQAVAIPSQEPEEDVAKVLRDGGRAVLWVMTGYTGYGESPSVTPPAVTPTPTR
ncbi:YdcF family protein [filamentous cyanobacterium LEGE 11480]|uniref:YdcF family protein n=1 Tax=Romeriopsis navalis LEGE 11480 TaxID=2777977 RepID=A0A928VMB4_9CYAN|nr:YdcF family protein [Romeriopsis navalis]MBE9028619.1 YdcF family protein [Romeriopsis navalis LEGE 11480]